MKTESRKAHDSKYQITPEERDWRAYRGESPNPWGRKNSEEFGSDGPESRTRTMQIITRRPMSRLERMSEWDKELAWYAQMPLSCRKHSRDEAYLHEHDCEACKAFMDYVRTHPN